MAEWEWIAWGNARFVDEQYMAGQVVEGVRDDGNGISSTTYQKQVAYIMIPIFQ
jgi:hypothetical protein